MGLKAKETAATTPGRPGVGFGARLRARRSEIEQATLARVRAIADPEEVGDPTYTEGLRGAIASALDYGLEAVEHGAERPPPVPVTLLAQARLAARNGVDLDTVLRRYLAGYTLLNDFLAQEAAVDLAPAELGAALRTQAHLFDRLLAEISEEYRREAAVRSSTAERRHFDRVRRLLDGEPVDTAALGYDLNAHHLGVAARGPRAGEIVARIAGQLDCRTLKVLPRDDHAWLWLGARRPPPAEHVRELVPNPPPAELSLAIGEPASGLEGWRLTHRQAAAALPVAMRGGERVVRYADVALLAAIAHDDLLVESLRQLYLRPLEFGRDRGKAARETLRAYLAANRNLTAAAAALGVNRHTVATRLRAIEGRLGGTIESHIADLEVALRLEQLDCP